MLDLGRKGLNDTQAAKLGSIEAHDQIAKCYKNGFGKGVKLDISNMDKAQYHMELAAIGGHEIARHNLGCEEGMAGNYDRAYKHFILAARAGLKDSLESVKQGYVKGYVTKEEYANALREYQKSQDEMKSETRDKALAARAE